ncbi:MAG: glutathionylspermidine synthase family protein [Syntrophus sp. (in: bacteria)]|nr:glutathionylspermidine synthase family protein [Syntrophus sp. (in: bacteria)]
MKRIPVPYMRRDWQKKLDDLGFHFYRMDGETYWDESIYYEFTSPQIDHLEEVTNELHKMCLNLVEYVIRNNLYEKFGIPLRFAEYIKMSWQEREPSIYGRFDFWYDGKEEPRLLEFNADTPTALFEASVVQYNWLQDYQPDEDQFNSIHEKLLAVMEDNIRKLVRSHTLFFSCVKDHLEDLTTTEYLRDLAIQAGIITKHIYIDDVGYDYDFKKFVDIEETDIEFMFKLYPWEWIISEQFSDQLLDTKITLLEPPWKMILSNKAILPLLWEMYPGHKNLLPSFFTPINTGAQYVEKPFFSREGDGIRVDNHFGSGQPLSIYQEYKELPQFSGNYPVIGSWIIGSEAAGIGIREDRTPITNNMSRFVPHLFID